MDMTLEQQTTCRTWEDASKNKNKHGQNKVKTQLDMSEHAIISFLYNKVNALTFKKNSKKSEAICMLMCNL